MVGECTSSRTDGTLNSTFRFVIVRSTWMIISVLRVELLVFITGALFYTLIFVFKSNLNTFYSLLWYGFCENERIKWRKKRNVLRMWDDNVQRI